MNALKIATNGILITAAMALALNGFTQHGPSAFAAERQCSTATPVAQRPTLSPNDTGSCVSLAQRLLIGDGALAAQYQTGGFYSITRAAVRDFQARNQVPTTGNVGPLTWAALEKAATGRASSVDPRSISYSKSEGKAVIDISGKDRKVRLVENGVVTMALDARFGTPEKPSHDGEFKVYLKAQNYKSKTYNGAPMPYTMMFYDGEAVHYSTNFANGIGTGSGGCTNTRDESGTAAMFNKVKVGTRVIAHGVNVNAGK